MKRARQMVDASDEPVETHDSGFLSPMVMFPTFPHNDTFVDNRVIDIRATPISTTAETYTLVHHKQEYGILNLEDAKIVATISLKTALDADLGNDQIVALNMRPLHNFWKSKEILINNQPCNTVTSQENELAYVRHLMDEVPSGYRQSESISCCIHDTPGHFDSITNIEDGAAGCLNWGARKRYLACNQATALECYDSIDLTGDKKRYVVSSFELKIRLTCLEQVKMLLGNAGHCAAARVHMADLRLIIPAMKPQLQLTQAINQAMIQRGEECKYYIRTYRYVPHTVGAGTQRIILSDMFTGSRPTRVITYLRTQTRYNGAYTLNPNSMIFPPHLEFFGLKINDALVSPTIANGREAYLNLRQVLNRRYDEMPFSFEDYLTDYGMIVTDLTENKDSYNRVLPNTTSGVVGLEMRFTQALAVNSQLINIAEFRNQLSVGYQSEARQKYTF
jgi:hypothetical protein